MGLLRHTFGSLAGMALLGWAARGLGAHPPGDDLGIVIMGTIVQKDAQNNVALIKEPSGSVRAIKRDYVVAGRYKVAAILPDHIELRDKDGKLYHVYQDKFAAGAGHAGAEAAKTTGADEYREEGFERKGSRVTMTGTYRDKLVKDDLARVLMQATAEPYLENGQIAGFILSQLDDGSIYTKMGLKDGDIVTQINDQELTSVANSIKLLQSLKGASHVEVEVRRGDQRLRVSLDVN